jgi:hypothetical protein
MLDTDDVPAVDLKVGLGVALLAIGIVFLTAIYTAPLMLECGWGSPRTWPFAGSLGITLALALRAAIRYAGGLVRRGRGRAAPRPGCG